MTELYLIGDDLTVTGFGLAGVKKAFKATPESIGKILNEIKEEADIIVITNALYETAEDKIEKIRSTGKIVIKIPDRSGGGEDIVSKLIRDTVGFEIKSKDKREKKED
jgi:vacuolar-type H+-ATPase subunit F/Vma7